MSLEFIAQSVRGIHSNGYLDMSQILESEKRIAKTPAYKIKILAAKLDEYMVEGLALDFLKGEALIEAWDCLTATLFWAAKSTPFPDKPVSWFVHHALVHTELDLRKFASRQQH